ncbi:AMP-binding protein [Lacrimispora xylanisolvens]|uniref:AMP-binding protein n=1 Tax=Lacrimispora xylanisolvens TaxID=384636 RepID=UPI0032E7F587
MSFDSISNMSDKRPVVKQVTGEETLIITMTSGSTGEPKPIDLTQKNKLERAMAHIRLYNLTKEDRILAATPLYHSLAERLVLMPLLIGATSILLPRFTPALWLNCVKDQKVTFTIAVSAQLGQIAELLTSPFVPEIDSLRCVVSSSSLLENHIKNELIDKLNCDFHEMYGTSETSTVTSINFRETMGKNIPLADRCRKQK